MIFGGTDMCERYVPEKPAVSIEQLTADASLFIKLSDHLLETPRPIMPDTVAMGHLMGRPAKPLQGDFKQLMDTSKGNIVLEHNKSHLHFDFIDRYQEISLVVFQ